MKRFTKWVVLATVALVISVSSAGCTSNVANQTNGTNKTSAASFDMATHDSGNFTILYPKGWANVTAGLSSMDYFSVTCTTKNNTYISVGFMNTSTISLDSYTAAYIKALKNNTNVTLIDEGNATLAGNPAHKVVYTTNFFNTTVKTMEIWTVKDGKIYLITYRASPENYDVYADTVQKIVDSFKIT